MPRKPKPLEWIGRAQDELASFPPEARHAAGYALWEVQRGNTPPDWKPMSPVGDGACEIRVRTHAGGTVQHRVLYVARFEEAVYVLHAFQKRTRATSQHNIDVGRARYAQMLRERQDRNHPHGGGTR